MLKINKTLIINIYYYLSIVLFSLSDAVIMVFVYFKYDLLQLFFILVILLILILELIENRLSKSLFYLKILLQVILIVPFSIEFFRPIIGINNFDDIALALNAKKLLYPILIVGLVLGNIQQSKYYKPGYTTI